MTGSRTRLIVKPQTIGRLSEASLCSLSDRHSCRLRIVSSLLHLRSDSTAPASTTINWWIQKFPAQVLVESIGSSSNLPGPTETLHASSAELAVFLTATVCGSEETSPAAHPNDEPVCGVSSEYNPTCVTGEDIVLPSPARVPESRQLFVR